MEIMRNNFRIVIIIGKPDRNKAVMDNESK